MCLHGAKSMCEVVGIYSHCCPVRCHHCDSCRTLVSITMTPIGRDATRMAETYLSEVQMRSVSSHRPGTARIADV